MPTYTYQCRECENRFERFQKMTDPAVTECPSCGGSVRKVMHPPAIAFKGPGFYVNDYKNNSAGSRRAELKGEAEPKAETAESKTEAKSESKTEAKTESKVDGKIDSKTPAPAAA